MKKLFLSLVAIVMTTLSYAQSSLVATLTHGDETSMYYGTYALRDAVNAAENGDVINLSGGSFQNVKITKALTIRGAGVADVLPTTITGWNTFQIEIPTNVTESLYLEGCIITCGIDLSGTLSNAYFLKDDIKFISVDMKNCVFVNCNVYGTRLTGSSTVQFINSYVSDFTNSNETASATFINCVIRPQRGDRADYMKFVQLINCILWNDYSSSFSSLPFSSSAWNCVAVGRGNNSVFNDLAIKQNCTAADWDIFIEGNVWNDLTEEAKTKYLGTDGTPVGMYGGIIPYNMVPAYPRITKMNVANKTTADGKLSVEIEVSATE